MTDHTGLILVSSVLAVLAAAQVSAAAGYLARRDHASWPQAVTRAATAFAATLTLAAVLATTVHVLIH